MGKGDNRSTRKMRRKDAQRDKKRRTEEKINPKKD